MVLSKKVKRIHFVGIGGAGMSGIAEVMHNMGFDITGSDLKKSEITVYLESLGIKISYGHSPENVKGAEVIVISTAIPENNPEVIAAKEKGIPVIKRAEMLAELMRMKYSVAVSGAHGKTTTTSMIAAIMETAGLDPTVVVGGKIIGARSGAKLGRSDYLVAEADESDMSFLKLFPTVAVITNIDEEHLDTYKNFENIKKAFVEFANKVPFYGCVILNLDNEGAREILGFIKRRKITYGLTRQAEIEARNIELENIGSRFSIYYQRKKAVDVHLNVPGVHNILNALASFTTGLELDIPPLVIKEGLENFKGVGRRFEIKGSKNGVIVVDDYGHHPNEILTTLETARKFHDGRIVVVFQPHRYTRTYYLHEKFGPVFLNADVLVITEIYPAGEKPIEGITAELIYNAVKKSGHRDVHYIPKTKDIIKFLHETLREGDLLLTLGAGNIYKIGEKILEDT